MKVSDIDHNWDGDHNQMARGCEVSRNTIINWVNAGKIPKLQAIRIEVEVLPRLLRRKQLMDELEKKLQKEFCRPLFDE